MPAGYRELYRQVRHAAEADDRIRAMWLGGSLGRGVADAGSDLDVVLAVAPGSFADFAESWRAWLAGVTPTVLAKELPGLAGSFYSLTGSCLRLDVVAERAGPVPPGALGRRLLVLDKDGTAGDAQPAAAEPGGPLPEAGPDTARLAGLTEEFFRQLAIFPAAVVARDDWLLGAVGVQNVQLMLYQLLVESNQPLPPMGVKQWSAKLTPQQRLTCAGLPVPSPSRESVLPAMRVAAATYRLCALEILAANDVPWPAPLDDAVQRCLEAELRWAI
jgi:hypothetical protein